MISEERAAELRAGITPGPWTTSRMLSNTIPPSAKVVLFESMPSGAFREAVLAECPPTTPGKPIDVGGGFASYPAVRNADFIAAAPAIYDTLREKLDEARALLAENEGRVVCSYCGFVTVLPKDITDDQRRKFLLDHILVC